VVRRGEVTPKKAHSAAMVVHGNGKLSQALVTDADVESFGRTMVQFHWFGSYFPVIMVLICDSLYRY
jgi:hypothetical protein